MRDHWDYDPVDQRAMIPLTEEEISAFHQQGITPPASAFRPPVAPVSPPSGREGLAKVPAWVTDPEKWQSLSRAERRALERYHRKVNGR